MLRFGLRLLLAAVAVLGLTAMTSAQAPLPPLPPAPPLPLPVPDALPVMPISPVVPMAPAMPAVRVLTVREFACTDFKPGTYTVFLIHPCTQCPVKVCFSLPACPRRVRVAANSLTFRWGCLLCKHVSIRFLPDGTVRVI